MNSTTTNSTPTAQPTNTPALPNTIAFIGGGNMASAMIGGLVAAGLPAASIEVVEPWEQARTNLQKQYGITAQEKAGSALARAQVVVWAVKPQVLREVATQTAPYTSSALHLSVAAGVRSDALARWLQSESIVRTMPNTPALIGMGMSGLFARPAVTAAQRDMATAIMSSTGQSLWVEDEALLDAVTAISGSAPAYVFYFLEAMTRAGTNMGLSNDQVHQLAVGTFLGASELARRSDEPPSVLRERVTSKGGTTFAALSSMQADGVGESLERAMQACQARAKELGDELGAD